MAKSGVAMWYCAAALSALALLLVAAADAAAPPAATPPVAPRRSRTTYFGTAPPDAEPGLEHRGASPMDPPVTRSDPYYWLRDDDRKDEEVLGLLRAENAHTQHHTAHQEELRQTVFGEMKARLQETDETARFRSGGFLYFERTVAGQSYAIHCRCRASSSAAGASSAAGEVGRCADGAEVEVLLDENIVAAGLPEGSQMSVGVVVVSPGHRFIAYTVDSSGYETFALHFKPLEAAGTTAALANERLEGTDASVVWSADERTVYYLRFDQQHRPAELWRHALGTSQSEDTLLYAEEDQLFALTIKRSVSFNCTSTWRAGPVFLPYKSKPEKPSISC
jgi:oligopeptidase B